MSKNGHTYVEGSATCRSSAKIGMKHKNAHISVNTGRIDKWRVALEST